MVPLLQIFFVFASVVSYFCHFCSTFEPAHDNTFKMACAPCEDSDQPGHPPSLIRVFAMRSVVAKGPMLSSCGQRRFWSDWADAQAGLSLRWAHMTFCRFCHALAHSFPFWCLWKAVLRDCGISWVYSLIFLYINTCIISIRDAKEEPSRSDKLDSVFRGDDNGIIHISSADFVSGPLKFKGTGYLLIY